MHVFPAVWQRSFDLLFRMTIVLLLGNLDHSSSKSPFAEVRCCWWPSAPASYNGCFGIVGQFSIDRAGAPTPPAPNLVVDAGTTQIRNLGEMYSQKHLNCDEATGWSWQGPLISQPMAPVRKTLLAERRLNLCFACRLDAGTQTSCAG